MANPTIHSGPEIPTRCQAHQRQNVPDRNEEDQVSLSPSLQQLLLIPPRQLSQGRFSHDNQQSLTGSKIELPIYEAKVTGDIRLVVCEALFAIQRASLIPLLSIR